MNVEEQNRFNMLRDGPSVTTEYFRDYYGVESPFSGELATDYSAWKKHLTRTQTCAEGWICRTEFEVFLKQQKLLPKKWMAAQLGMQEDSLDEFFKRISEVGMKSQRYLIYPELIGESFSQDILGHLPKLKFRVALNQDRAIELLHGEIERVFGIQVQPLICATSEKLQEEPRRFAYDFDCITLEPISIKHQTWLDFKKPVYLTPDRCSKLFYTENRDTLRNYLAGTTEPDDIERYEQFLGLGQNV